MKAYLITTGAIFALIVAAHVLRIIEEPEMLKQPPELATMVILTLLAAGLAVWAAILLRAGSRLKGPPSA